MFTKKSVIASLFFTLISFFSFGQLKVASNGRVCIGTGNPHVPLHIAGNTTNLLKLQSTTGGPWNSAGIEFLTFGGDNPPNARIAAIDQGGWQQIFTFTLNLLVVLLVR